MVHCTWVFLLIRSNQKVRLFIDLDGEEKLLVRSNQKMRLLVDLDGEEKSR